LAKVTDHPLPARVFHNVHLLSMVVLGITGWYIHRPSPALSMDTVRWVHMAAGFVMLATLAGRVYYAFFGYWRDYREFSPVGPFWATLRYHLFLERSLPGTRKYNVLQVWSYLFTALLLVLQALTGIALEWPDGSLGFVVLAAGGLANLRAVHYVLFWLFISGTAFHLYLVLTESYDRFLLMMLGRATGTTGQEGGR